jgi:hypothetical protein
MEKYLIINVKFSPQASNLNKTFLIYIHGKPIEVSPGQHLKSNININYNSSKDWNCNSENNQARSAY